MPVGHTSSTAPAASPVKTQSVDDVALSWRTVSFCGVRFYPLPFVRQGRGVKTRIGTGPRCPRSQQQDILHRYQVTQQGVQHLFSRENIHPITFQNMFEGSSPFYGLLLRQVFEINAAHMGNIPSGVSDYTNQAVPVQALLFLLSKLLMEDREEKIKTALSHFCKCSHHQTPRL